MRIVPHASRRPLAAIPIAALALLTVAIPPALAASKTPAAAPAAQKPADKPAKTDVTVMTRNLYVGADILVVAGAVDFQDFLVKAREFIMGVAATNFPERAGALAAEIADKKPDVVGMQEVYDLEWLGHPQGAPPFVNYLDVLLAALDRHGVRYRAVATVNEADIVAPADLDGDGVPESLVRVLDRDVILVREGINAAPLPLKDMYSGCRASADGCNYNVVAEVVLPFGSIKFERGFVGIMMSVGGVSHMVFNTHLEVRTPDPDNPYSAIVQAVQATELKSLLDALPPGRRLIVTGDFNSSPEDPIVPVPPPVQALYGLPPLINPPYRQFTLGENFYTAPLGSGLFDAWTLRPGKPPGLSCCQDADLLNPWSVLYERIDLVFSREEPAGVKANQVGNEPEDKTPSGLWPSDHAGLVVRYAF